MYFIPFHLIVIIIIIMIVLLPKHNVAPWKTSHQLIGIYAFPCQPSSLHPGQGQLSSETVYTGRGRGRGAGEREQYFTGGGRDWRKGLAFCLADLVKNLKITKQILIIAVGDWGFPGRAKLKSQPDIPLEVMEVGEGNLFLSLYLYYGGWLVHINYPVIRSKSSLLLSKSAVKFNLLLSV